MQNKSTVQSKTALLTYGLIISLDSISFGLIGPILAPLLANPGEFFPADHSLFFQHFIYGLLMALFPLTYMISAPLLGSLSDRIGRKKVLIGASIFISLSFLGYAMAFAYKSIGLLIFARMIGGIGAASQGVAQAAVIDFAKQNEKPLVISSIAIGMTMGLIIGPLFAGFWSYTYTWVPFCIVILINFITIYSLCAYTKNDQQPATPIRKNKTSTDLKAFFQTPNVARLLCIFFLFEIGWSLFYQGLPLLLSLRYKLQHQQIGFMCSFVGMMLAIFLYSGSRVGLKFISVSGLIKCGFIFGMTGLCLVTFDLPLSAFYFTSLPIVLAVALLYPGLISQLSLLISPEKQGLLMGLSDALIALAFAITGMVSPLLAYIDPALSFLVAATVWGFARILFQKNKNIPVESSMEVMVQNQWP